MKKYLLLAGITILLSINGFSQTGSDNRILKISKNKEDSIVNDIRKKFQIINSNYLSYQKADKDLMDYSSEGGHLAVYYDKSELKKIIASYFGETGKIIIEYYFWDDNIFFIFHQEYKYNSPIYITTDDPDSGLEAYDEAKTIVFANRYYFSGDKLIRWLDHDKNKVDRNSSKYIDKQSELLKDIEFIRSLINK